MQVASPRREGGGAPQATDGIEARVDAECGLPSPGLELPAVAECPQTLTGHCGSPMGRPLSDREAHRLSQTLFCPWKGQPCTWTGTDTDSEDFPLCFQTLLAPDGI